MPDTTRPEITPAITATVQQFKTALADSPAYMAAYRNAMAALTQQQQGSEPTAATPPPAAPSPEQDYGYQEPSQTTNNYYSYQPYDSSYYPYYAYPYYGGYGYGYGYPYFFGWWYPSTFFFYHHGYYGRYWGGRGWNGNGNWTPQRMERQFRPYLVDGPVKWQPLQRQ